MRAAAGRSKLQRGGIMEIRPLSWPADLPQLERLDTSFSTDIVYDVQSLPHGFAIVERRVTPSLLKQYPIVWEDLRACTAAIVAEREGVLLGVAALQHVAWNRRAAVAHLYVDRPARGQGIGARLVRDLHIRAKALHARCLWVETQNMNAPAIHFYERCGFVFSGLDLSLYDPQDTAGDIALYFVLPNDDE